MDGNCEIRNKVRKNKRNKKMEKPWSESFQIKRI